jgi:hypothetical protein
MALLTVPSAFEMGLSDCRWIYYWPANRHGLGNCFRRRTCDAWRVTVDGPMPFSRFRSSVLGQEFGPAG